MVSLIGCATKSLKHTTFDHFLRNVGAKSHKKLKAEFFCSSCGKYDDVIKWKHFPRYWLFVRGIHRSPVYSPSQRPVTRSFDVFFDLRVNERLSKQSRGWWFETPSRSLWRHCNECESSSSKHQHSSTSQPGHISTPVVYLKKYIYSCKGMTKKVWWVISSRKQKMTVMYVFRLSLFLWDERIFVITLLFIFTYFIISNVNNGHSMGHKTETKWYL